METEAQICRRYEAELARIANLDNAYYRSPCPSLAERRDYAARQAQIEEVRSRLYLELDMLHRSAPVPSHPRCRLLIRRPRFS
jgi:hypothetical protein